MTSFLPRMETCSLPALYLTASAESGTTPDSLDVGRAHAAGLRPVAGSGDRACLPAVSRWGRWPRLGWCVIAGDHSAQHIVTRCLPASLTLTRWFMSGWNGRTEHLRRSKTIFFRPESIGFHPADILEDADGPAAVGHRGMAELGMSFFEERQARNQGRDLSHPKKEDRFRAIRAG